MTPELDPRRAQFVLGRIDEILTWEKAKEKDRDVQFVELGEYLCEVRAKRYWRLERFSANLHVHHLVKRSKLGDDILDNLITLCARCHAHRHANLKLLTHV